MAGSLTSTQGVDMQVYGLRTAYDIWPAFYSFVDFLIRMMDEGKVEVTTRFFSGAGRGPADFYIWLSVDKGIKGESKIHFSYNWWLAHETTSPIRRFGFSLVSKGIVLADLRSQDAESYDKMLELFRAIMRYVEGHDLAYYTEVAQLVSRSILSLDRKDWKKSRKEIEVEFEKAYQTRGAKAKFERERMESLSQLINGYKIQGYEITE